MPEQKSKQDRMIHFHTLQCPYCYPTWNKAAEFSGGFFGPQPTLIICGSCAASAAHSMFHKGWHKTFLFSIFVGMSELPKDEEAGLVKLCRLPGDCSSIGPHWIPYNIQCEVHDPTQLYRELRRSCSEST